MNNPKSKKILRTIYSMQGVSRPCLLKMSRYTPPTLYRIIDELMRDGYVVVSGTGEESGKGRPTDLLSLNGDLGQVAVLHISRTTFSCWPAAVMSLNQVLPPNNGLLLYRLIWPPCALSWASRPPACVA